MNRVGVGLQVGLFGVAAVMTLGACGTNESDSSQPTSPSGTPTSTGADASSPVTAQEDADFDNYGVAPRPTVVNDSTTTVYVSYQDGVTNKAVEPGGQLPAEGRPNTFRITHEGGGQTLFVSSQLRTETRELTRPSNFDIDIYPTEGAAVCRSLSWNTAWNNSASKTEDGSCQGRDFSMTITRMDAGADQMTLVLTGDGWG